MRISFLLQSFYALLTSLNLLRVAFADLIEADINDCSVQVVIDLGGGVTENTTRKFDQGEVVCVSVFLSEEGIEEGLVMDRIENFTYTAPDGITQVAIDDNAIANFLTDYSPSDCENSTQCVFSSTLIAPFFIQVQTLTGSGIASLKFDCDATDCNEENTVTDTTQSFNVTFEVIPGAPRVGSSTVSAASSPLCMVAASLAAVIVNIFILY